MRPWDLTEQPQHNGSPACRADYASQGKQSLIESVYLVNDGWPHALHPGARAVRFSKLNTGARHARQVSHTPCCSGPSVYCQFSSSSHRTYQTPRDARVFADSVQAHHAGRQRQPH